MNEQNNFEEEMETVVVGQDDMEVIDNETGKVITPGNDKLIIAGLIGAGIVLGGGLLVKKVIVPFFKGAAEGVKKANQKPEKNEEESDE